MEDISFHSVSGRRQGLSEGKSEQQLSFRDSKLSHEADSLCTFYRQMNSGTKGLPEHKFINIIHNYFNRENFSPQ